MTFSIMTLISALATLGLGFGFLFAPAAMLKPWGLENPTPAAVMSRRIGAVYLVGRVLYFREYIQQPTSRTLGFSLSFLPILALLIAALAGIIRSL